MTDDQNRLNRPSPPSMLSAETRKHTEEARRRLDSMRGAPSEPPGKIVSGDVLIQTSEEQLLESIVDCRGSAEKTQIVLSYVEELLRSGELRFKNSQTHAGKVRHR